MTTRRRVILDANIFVSAAISNGASRRIVEEWMASNSFDVIMCQTLLEEIGDVLRRPRLRRFIQIDVAEAFLETIGTLVDLVPNPTTIHATTRDPADDYLIALANEHAVDLIVTGDKDLLEWVEQSPSTLPPAAFEVLLTLPPGSTPIDKP